jgi:peroxiredoxin
MTETTGSTRNQTGNALLPLLLIVLVILQSGVGLVLLAEVRSLRQEVGALYSQAITTDSGASTEGLSPGSAAPGFELIDTEGNTVSLDDYRAERVLLVFTSTSCQYCTALYPELQQFALSHGNDDLAVALLSFGSATENRSIKQEQHLAIDILTAGQEPFNAYRVPATPFLVLLDANRRVVKSGVANNAEQIESFVSSS